jgi:uncharacterized SAM-binding protein YcdF (DUF218 family)
VVLLVKFLRFLLFFAYAWGVIIAGSYGVFLLVRNQLTDGSLPAAIVATVAFMFAAMFVGEQLSRVVNRAVNMALLGRETRSCGER